MNAGNAYQDIDGDALVELLARDAILIDVRGDAEVAQGMIDGATHIPMHLLPLRASDLARDKPVVFYCRTGARSGQVCAFLAQQGYNNLHNLTGGIMSWARAGKPIVMPCQHAA